MKSIQVFESSNFYNKSSDDAAMNQLLMNFAVDVNWAERNAIQIERIAIDQRIMTFANNQVVNDFIERSGQEALPLILVNGEFALSGRYPNRIELSSWAGLSQPVIEINPTYGCCSGGKCG